MGGLMDPCAVWTFLAFAVFLVALVGHGIWLLFAALFRVLAEQPRSDSGAVLPSDPPRRTCARCGTNFSRARRSVLPVA